MDEFKLVESDDELNSQPICKGKKVIKTVEGKREQFRLQIRREQIEEQLEKKRMWFMPKKRNENTQILGSVASLYKKIEEKKEIAAALHALASVVDDRNRVNSLYLTQRNFLQFRDLLMEESYYIDTYTIYLQLTQDEEFFHLPIVDIQWSAARSLELLSENKHLDELANSILGYLGNVASKLEIVQKYLLEKDTLTIIGHLIREPLQHNVCYLTQSLCTHIPEDQKHQLIVALHYLPLRNSQEVLQTLYIINKQCTTFSEQVDYKKMFELLFHFIEDYVANELDFESFYSALMQLKFLSDFAQLLQLYLDCNILNVINRLINYKYQKIRTAVLYVLQSLCKGGHKVIVQIFESQELLKKLINILTTDKPINQSLVIKCIIHILKYGNQQDYVTLMDLGLAVHLKSTLLSSEPYIVIQGLECTTCLLSFGVYLQQQLNIPNVILTKLQQHSVITLIEELQYHPNQEVFVQAQKLINTFFRVE